MPTYEELYKAAFGSSSARREAWNVKFLAVQPDSQRKGLGKMLIATLCKKVCTPSHPTFIHLADTLLSVLRQMLGDDAFWPTSKAHTMYVWAAFASRSSRPH